ncbi:MAG: acyl-CoA dehydrogenase family protein [Nocardiopsaceae bacterium]|jgi:acyl-CoA dehydrogenase|nr:acyl-CoA dehydrogenase family protein [Nocardiopsaceae bacterium]
MTTELGPAVMEITGTEPVSSEDQARERYQRLAANGWATVGIPSHLGGSGGSMADAAAVVAAVAASGPGIPIGETAIIAGWLLAAAGLALPEAGCCAVPVLRPAEAALTGTGNGGLLTLRAPRVAWASWASHLIVPVPLDENRALVVTLENAHAVIRHGVNLAGESRDDVETAGVPVQAAATADMPFKDLLAGLHAAGALARSIQIAAALRRVTGMTARYCTQRSQFGRPLTAFQAVQQQLAELAAESAAADAAVTFALGRRDAFHGQVSAAVAKARTSQAAGAGARIAHQLHGAIGVTQEHPLPRYTRALWAWRDEYGSETSWSRLLAERAADADEPLWEWVTADE